MPTPPNVPAPPADAALPSGPGTVLHTREMSVDAATAWAALTDARRHGAWVPLTRVETDGDPAVGTRVVAVSGPGARGGAGGFVDRMVVTRLDPPGDGTPGIAVFAKRGPWLTGSAAVVVTPTGAGRCRVTWSEHVPLLGPLPAALTARLTALPLLVMLRVVLARAARELEGGTAR
ncbi:SRPBCC family protein [Cellulomonas oligotrophica]|uniref:Uncharacterized protein YndB with AHSA1/START domain n=1 Tax=Cellulomonas oligotrophica TaxID=931536 RepID=A0A7Y9FI30_9CELL|nr:SRPBCC family protein [Cellulomonas oligotrophica]NYD87322.1 uncharacterized protein YndB with AHSA1/START domain [Cellulomonas oligotrophica]GIG34241.1 hypothetical protein Col01nite_34000 [Cellulomonas oligotrophica]